MKKKKDAPGLSVTKIAESKGRNYIMPEDIVAALKTEKVDRVRRDVLAVLGNITDYGAEDRGLCAFAAWRGRNEK